jgi:uncharacterized protein
MSAHQPPPQLVSFLRYLAHRPWKTMCVVLLLSIAAGIAGAGLQIRAQMEDLFPGTTPNIQRMKQLEKRLGYTSQIRYMIASPDREANIRFASDLVEQVEAHPQVLRVDFRRNIQFFRKNALLFLPMDELVKLRKRVKARVRKAVARDLGPFDDEDDSADGDDDDDEFDDEFDDGFDDGFGDDTTGKSDDPAEAGVSGLAMPDEQEVRRKFGLSHFGELPISDDGTLIGFRIYPTISPDDVEASYKLAQDIDAMVAQLDPDSYHPQLHFAVDGGFHRRINMMLDVKSDLKTTSIVAGIVILLLIVLYFGRIRSVLFVMLPMGAGVLWTVGISRVAVGNLNTITSFIFTILFGLGVDFAIHATSRYFELRGTGLEVEDAAVEAVARLGRAMVSAAVTTSMTFLSLSFLDFRGFSQFGIIAGFGIPICLVAVALIFPPLAVLADRLWKEPPGWSPSRMSGVPGFLKTRRAGLFSMGVLIAVMLALTPLIPGVHLQADLTDVQTPEPMETRLLALHYALKVDPLTAQPIIISTETTEEAREIHDHLTANRDSYPALENFVSLFSFLPDNQAEKLPIIADIRETIQRKKGAMEGEAREDAERAMEYLAPAMFTQEALPAWVKTRFTDADDQMGRVLFLFSDAIVTDAGDIRRVLDQLDVLDVNGRQVPTVGSFYIAHDAYELVRSEGPMAVALGATAVFLLLLLDLRSFRLALLAFIPLPVGVAIFLGLSRLAGWPLNIFNMVILPTFFGIGVDTSIHLIHRVRNARRRDPGIGREKLVRLVASTGAAAGMSAITTGAGFACLMLATNPGVASIGKLAPVGIGVCFLSSVVIVGGVLVMRPRR